MNQFPMLQNLSDETLKTPQESGIVSSLLGKCRKKKAWHSQGQNKWFRWSCVEVVIRKFWYKQIQNGFVLNSTVIACIKY